MDDSKTSHGKLKGAQKMSRRSFLKGAGGSGVAALTLAAGAKSADAAPAKSLKGTKLAMVIDLQRCTGCGGCFIACKSENNVQTGNKWTWPISKTVGTFPNVGLDFIPALCNHCENAPCVKVCPAGAMCKGDGGITTHTPENCIGCRSCFTMCPFGSIERHSEETHKFWRSTRAAIDGCTSIPADVTKKVGGTVIPNYNADRERHLAGSGLRTKGIVEKCTFCDHRVKEGKLPFCVVSCPANARVFGDLNDPDSDVSKLVAKYRPMRLKEHLGTEPRVFYIRSFNPSGHKRTKGSI